VSLDGVAPGDADDAWALADRLVLAAVEAQVLGEVEHPVRIGKYEIDRPLGAGAMGQILLARDEQLRRQVALKLISPHLTDVPTARERIVQEARAMAKLSDPHVAQVYEVGEADGQLFVAMEFVDGENLRRWLAAEERPWRQIIDVFVQAGRGLAAAHAKGLVHRDFKPDNVMLEHDGRARVVDFGLARGSGQADAEIDDRDEDAPATLTSTGTWLGTPAYMSPEQWDGSEVDARSDQFSFCVSVYEALTGARPFAGESGGQVRAALDRGVVPPMPRARRIPRRIESAIARGLQIAPDDRWPGMDALLRALAPRSRGWIMGVVSAGALIGAAGLTAARGDDPCASAGAPIDALWNAESRAGTERAITHLPAPWAAATAAAVLPRYDATAEAWRQAAGAACATEDAPPAWAQCLDYARARLGEALDAVASGDPAHVVAAVSHAELLTDPRACLQPSSAAWPADGGSDTGHRADTEAARRLGELSTAAGAEHYVASLAAGREAAALATSAARDDGDVPLAAHAAWLRGRLDLRDGDKAGAELAFREAAELAAQSGQGPLRAAATVELVYVVGNDRDRSDEAQTLATDADALLAAVGAPPVWTARLAAHRASALAHARSPDARRAIELHGEAVEGLREVLGDSHPDVIVELGNLGAAYNYAGEADEAEATLREALRRATAVWGPGHPRTARLEGTLGLSRMRQKDLTGARAHLQRSLDVRIEALGPDHAEVASARFNLATVLRLQDEHEPALTLLRRGLQTREAADGPLDPGHITWLVPIGSSELSLGRLDAAAVALQRAVDLLEREGGTAEQFAEIRFALAQAYASRDPAQARVLAASARRAYPVEAPQLADIDAFLADLDASSPAR
jgi:tetratricopeptide (TPR) repeat protein/predicted Ser/Thr protein kinase